MRKLLWPVIGSVLMAVLMTVQEAMNDRAISSQEWVMVAIQATMVAHVYLTANLPQYEKMKTWVSGVVAVLQTLYVVIVAGLDTPEIIGLVITYLAAVGVSFTRQPVTTVVEGKTVTPDERADGATTV